MNIHESSFANLKRGLATIRRLPFLVAHAQVNAWKASSNIWTADKRRAGIRPAPRHYHVHAGSNMLARRIYQRYQRKQKLPWQAK